MAGRGQPIEYNVYKVSGNDLVFLGSINARGARNAISSILASRSIPSENDEFVAFATKNIVAYAAQTKQKVSLEPVGETDEAEETVSSFVS